MLHSKANNRIGPTLAVGLSLLALTGSGLTAEAQTKRTARLETGTVLPVVLEDELSSHKSRKGDRFTAKLQTGERAYLGLPEGTRLEGVVTEARRKTDSKTPGVLDIEFQRLRLPDGNAYAIDSELIPLDDKNVETKDNGRIVAKPGHKREDLKYVGYGAGAGLLISLLGKGKLSLENILLGGLLGYGAGQLIKGPQEARDVVLKPGTEVGVRLDKPLRFVTSEEYIPEDDRAPLDDRDPIVNDDMDNDFAVMMDDRNVRFTSNWKPFQAGTVWMLPVKAMMNTEGVSYTYGRNKRTVEVSDGEKRFTGTVGSNIVTSNGQRFRLDKPLRLVNGEIFAPVRFFELTTGTVARYDRDSNTLVFNR